MSRLSFPQNVLPFPSAFRLIQSCGSSSYQFHIEIIYLSFLLVWELFGDKEAPQLEKCGEPRPQSPAGLLSCGLHGGLCGQGEVTSFPICKRGRPTLSQRADKRIKWEAPINRTVAPGIG